MLLKLKNGAFVLFCVLLFTCLRLQCKNNPDLTWQFIENKGQILNQNYEVNEDVLFLYTGRGIKIQLRTTGFSYELFSVHNLPKTSRENKFLKNTSELLKTTVENYRVDLDFYGMNHNTVIETGEKSSDYLNYVVCGKEISNVYSYNKVTYVNIFKNTDIEFILTGDENAPFKYNIILHAGSDINDVKFLVRGASHLQKTSGGSIDISTPPGLINEKIPFSYYIDKPEENIKVEFKLAGNIISFSSAYNPSKTLVIDPSSNLIWSTYFGGSAIDYCNAIGIDGQNNVYITGYSLSTNNIATSGTYQNVLSGAFDVYLTKFNSNGVRLWGTYFGGSSTDVAYAMYVEPGGSIYVCGDSFSTSNVASPGAYQTVYGGGIDDALLVKFNSSGQRVWSTYFGGTMHDIAQAIVVDKMGDIIITGHTESANAISTQGAYNTVYTFNYDVFIAKFNSGGSLLWGTYYGDSGVDEAYGIACDTLNSIFVTGGTQSSSGLSTTSAYQVSSGGQQDAFIAKFNSSGTNLVWGTYYGGLGNDFGTAIEVSKSGLVFICGTTTSGNNISTANSYQTNLGSADDSFLTCFNNNGQQQWGSYFGGNDVDYITDLVLDPGMNLLFCGSTLSTNSISTTGAYQATLAANFTYDAYLAKFTSSGKRKLATYFGGTTNDNAKGIAIDNTGKIYIAGETTSTLGISTPGSYMPNTGGGGDAFLAKFCITYEPIISPAGSITLCPGNTTLQAPSGFSTYLWNNSYTVNPLVVNSTTLPGTYYFSVAVTDGFGCGGASDTSKIVILPCITNIVQFENLQEIKLYPSPANDLVSLEIQGACETAESIVELYSSTGQLILKQETTEHLLKVDTQNLSPGIYILRVKTSDQVFEKKLIKE